MSKQVKVTKTVCRWCHSSCRVAVEVRNGRLVRITENKEHPNAELFSRVIRACPRARMAAEWFYHPDRLNYPLKRGGERGEGKWQRISWEQALDEIAAKLKNIKESYGAEAITTSKGTGRTDDYYRARFLNLLGSPNNIGQGMICWSVNNMVSSAILGWPSNNTVYRPGITRCLLLIGTNPAQSVLRSWLSILDAKKQGAKLIVIDPRLTETAARADIWLQLRPGTDTALLMGMINVIITEGLYDREFVDKWCYGFEKLAERAREYSLEKVAEITLVPADKIREAARTYATNRPAACHSRMGLEHLSNSVEALHARFILPAITGNIDVAGGDVFLGGPLKIVSEAELELNEKVPAQQRGKQLGAERFRLMSWVGYDFVQQNVKRVWGRQLPRNYHCLAHAPTVFQAILTDKPYAIKAMLTLANNPLVAFPNTKLVYEALKKLDLFVVMDYFLTPSAELSDYVLPAASWLERPMIATLADVSSAIHVGEAALPCEVEGEYDRKRDYDFWRGLGVRLGQEKYWSWQSLEEAYDYRLAPMGYTLKQFMNEKGGYYLPPPEYKKYENKGFGTPTGKVELYSTIFERLGYDPLPQYEEPAESPVSNPELAKEYPLILITGGRFLPMYHSEWRQVDSARRQHPAPIVQLHPQKASEMGISDGDWVWIETPRGRMQQKCQYFEGIAPKVIHAEHGWWFPELPGEEPWLHGLWESNINIVTNDDPQQCNRLSGGWPLRASLCKVYKVESNR